MPKSYDSVIDDLRNLVDDLGRFDQMADLGNPIITECLLLGLPLMETKYGLSSQEADTVRAIIADHE